MLVRIRTWSCRGLWEHSKVRCWCPTFVVLNCFPPCILGTHHEKGAQTFWAAVNRLPISSNAVLCWKFCHVFHKLLRDGHPNVSSVGILWVFIRSQNTLGYKVHWTLCNSCLHLCTNMQSTTNLPNLDECIIMHHASPSSVLKPFDCRKVPP